jgi:hypothetical protein
LLQRIIMTRRNISTRCMTQRVQYRLSLSVRDTRPSDHRGLWDRGDLGSPEGLSKRHLRLPLFPSFSLSLGHRIFDIAIFEPSKNHYVNDINILPMPTANHDLNAPPKSMK